MILVLEIGHVLAGQVTAAVEAVVVVVLAHVVLAAVCHSNKHNVTPSVNTSQHIT